MGLLGLLKGAGKLAIDAVDGAVEVGIDVVKGDLGKAGERLFEKVPKRVGEFLDEASKED